MSRPNLEEELTTGLAELRSILGLYSTYAVTAQCFGYMIGTAHQQGGRAGTYVSGEAGSIPVERASFH